MLRSLGNRPLRWGLALLVVSLAAGGARTGPARSDDDGAVLARDSRVLLRRGLGVGLVLTDVAELHAAPTTKSPPVSSEAEADVAVLIEGMRRRWSPQFEVTEAGDGVNVVAAGATRCREAMAIALQAGSYRGTPIEVLYQLAARLDPSLRGLPPPGIVGAGPPGVRDELMKDVLMQPLALEHGAGSLQEVLNQLAKAAPTLGWFAAERCANGRCRCELGLLTPNAAAFPGYDASVGLPPQK